MVSEATEPMTRVYLDEHGLPGVDRASIRLVVQGNFPCLDDEGRLLLAAKDRIAVSPDGHGGVLRALRLSGSLAWLANLGVDVLSTFQVDNALAPPADPLFLGLHRIAEAQMSCKVFPKVDPAEKVGVVVGMRGKRGSATGGAGTGGAAAVGVTAVGVTAVGVVEYSELSEEHASRRDGDGQLVFGAANMAAHAVALPFAAAAAYAGLPVHRVRKIVPHVDADGGTVTPPAPNAWKFETFLFDALPLATRAVVLEVDRAKEFAPVKNRTGADSPDTARALLKAAGRWDA
jgi:UDP-N-acetylglucosamine/UDP-N-acetylgalactosamine diphosphorylase